VPDRAPIAERWSSRKFLAAMFWQAVMVALLWAGVLPSEAFVAVTYLILGGYLAGNVAQKIWEPREK
jgi:hypothetical protein